MVDHSRPNGLGKGTLLSSRQRMRPRKVHEQLIYQDPTHLDGVRVEAVPRPVVTMSESLLLRLPLTRRRAVQIGSRCSAVDRDRYRYVTSGAQVWQRARSR